MSEKKPTAANKPKYKSRENCKWCTITLRRTLCDKVGIVCKAQEITFSEFVRRLICAELRRLNIDVSEDESIVKRGYRSQAFPEGHLSIRQRRKLKRREKLIKGMMEEFPTMPADLLDFYNSGGQK